MPNLQRASDKCFASFHALVPEEILREPESELEGSVRELYKKRADDLTRVVHSYAEFVSEALEAFDRMSQDPEFDEKTKNRLRHSMTWGLIKDACAEPLPCCRPYLELLLKSVHERGKEDYIM